MRHLPVLLAALTASADAQVLLGGRPRETAVIRVDVDLVNVVFSVRDGRGAFAKDLGRDDFDVREQGRKVEIGYFTRDIDTPLTVALLLDVSGSVSAILDIEKRAGSRFFREVLRPQDKAMLVGFANLIGVWRDLTSETAALEDALDKAGPFPLASLTSEYRPRGGTLLYDAILQASTRKLRPLQGRKIIVVISDGLDNGSVRTLDDAVRAAQEADVSIYGIHYQASGAQGDGQGVLKRLAEPTGGRSFHIGGKVPLEAAFDAIRDEMRNQYGIGFKPSNPEMDGEWRKIEIRTRSGLKVQARNGYYATRK